MGKLRNEVSREDFREFSLWVIECAGQGTRWRALVGWW